MNLIETAAPISIDNLKKYFENKDTRFIISYSESTLKKEKLLTYLSNLDIPCDINFANCSEEECYEMLQTYLHSPMLVNIPSIEQAVIHILGQARKVYPMQDEKFINDNQEILNSWNKKLDSLTLYNMDIVADESFTDFVESFSKDDTDSLEGINFVSLIKNSNMFDLYSNIDQTQLTYYTKYFNDYMFKGKNLYSFWATENNPMFLLTFGIAEGIVTPETYTEALKKDQETLHVPSV